MGIEMNESTRLRIEPPDTTIFNEYRLHQGRLEVRTCDRASSDYPHDEPPWRPLTDDELNSHIALNTVVAQWMSSKLWRSEDD